ncbi:MAG: hypothetical protein MUC33_12465 [Desulfobacterales bacterium]|nr:hypothetical protein [Desulfobacterales bacterium]MCU0603465.1 hypothetical protein [Desulfobacterales bacterium]
MPRLRDLRRRVPGQGDPAQLVRGRAAAVQGGRAAGCGAVGGSMGNRVQGSNEQYRGVERVVAARCGGHPDPPDNGCRCTCLVPV